jgi:hypothetical protein
MHTSDFVKRFAFSRIEFDYYIDIYGGISAHGEFPQPRNIRFGDSPVRRLLSLSA